MQSAIKKKRGATTKTHHTYEYNDANVAKTVREIAAVLLKRMPTHEAEDCVAVMRIKVPWLDTFYGISCRATPSVKSTKLTDDLRSELGRPLARFASIRDAMLGPGRTYYYGTEFRQSEFDASETTKSLDVLVGECVGHSRDSNRSYSNKKNGFASLDMMVEGDGRVCVYWSTKFY